MMLLFEGKSQQRNRQCQPALQLSTRATNARPELRSKSAVSSASGCRARCLEVLMERGRDVDAAFKGQQRHIGHKTRMGSRSEEYVESWKN